MAVPLGGGPVPHSLGITRHAALARTARKLAVSTVRASWRGLPIGGFGDGSGAWIRRDLPSVSSTSRLEAAEQSRFQRPGLLVDDGRCVRPLSTRHPKADSR